MLEIGFDGKFGASFKTEIGTELSINQIMDIYNNFDSTSFISDLATLALESTNIDLGKTKLGLNAGLNLSLGLDAFIGSIAATAGIEGDVQLKPVLRENDKPSLDQKLTFKEIYDAIFPDEKDVKLTGVIKPPLGLYDAEIDFDMKAIDGDEPGLDASFPHINIGFEQPIYINKSDPNQFTFVNPKDDNYLTISSTGWIYYHESIKEIKEKITIQGQVSNKASIKLSFDAVDIDSSP